MGNMNKLGTMRLSVMIAVLSAQTILSSEVKTEASPLQTIEQRNEVLSHNSPQKNIWTEFRAQLNVQGDDEEEIDEEYSSIISLPNIQSLDDYELYITEKIMPRLEGSSLCTIRCFSVTLLIFMIAAVISYFVVHHYGII